MVSRNDDCARSVGYFSILLRGVDLAVRLMSSLSRTWSEGTVSGKEDWFERLSPRDLSSWSAKIHEDLVEPYASFGHCGLYS